ncbi:glycosyltransferase family 20-domain-containing protein [Lophiotrema nucula]|uniref:Glycosyltransferase family 20-domain-containing protein n=1 Tax=Lophiotrema nucula TaxID=690887 RepID=A0A6A5Z005_9PLEO|nr:glycosyltransferase family 20-domain-containing protein [Lophiotrema nucula]
MATTLVVSLFLPNTIDFAEPELEAETNSAPKTLGDIGRQASVYSIESQKQSLLPLHFQTPPVTPRPTEENPFFVQDQPSAKTHFANLRDPRTLVRSDSHLPEWSAGQLFNQPRLRIAPAPPETILENVQLQKKSTKSHLAPRNTSRSQSKMRAQSKDPWATEWKVVSADQGNGGLVNAVRSCQDEGNMGDVLNIGLIGFPTDALDEEKKAEIYDKLETEHESLIVFVSDKDYDGHYHHFCKTILWPVFHYQIPDHPKSKAYADHSWVYYERLNQAFADKVVANYKRGDVIWIHDYHLLLVPGMIRKKLPDAKIGFFLHAAFPSSEVFRCLAKRNELLEGMLGANLVAFQTQEYAHHFLQTCSRILSVEATEDGIQLDNQFVNVWYTPIGIYPKALTAWREEPETLDCMEEMRKKYKDKKLIVARDKLDSIRGVRQKLLAFELFLNQYPEWVDKVVLIQVATSDVENDDLASTVSEIVTRIDAVHSTLQHNPLVFLRQDLPFPQYLALLSMADALMVTSLRDGMNLTVHEFIICQDGETGGPKHGPVILSEFTGSAAVFEGNELSVNPWDYKSTADAIKTALEMPEHEKIRRYTRMREIVLSQTGATWMRQLSDHLTKVHDEHYRRDTMSIPRLSVARLVQDYQKANKRLFIIDYEGTLASWGNVSNTVLVSPQRVTDVLNDLVSDENNLVYIMSGRTIEELEIIFGRVPGLGLIAENGCYLRDIRSDSWTSFANETKTEEWMTAVKDTLQYYLERVEGSWLEERHCSLIFHYEKADEFDSASRHAGEAASHISDACQSQRVRAFPSKDSVVIEPMDWDKGTAATHIWSQYKWNETPDFLMVAGNDRDDEVVFRWARGLKETFAIENVTSVSVGNRNTVAMTTLTNGTTGLLNALDKLAKLTANDGARGRHDTARL